MFLNTAQRCSLKKTRLELKKMLFENSYVRKEGFGNTYRDSLGAQTAAFCNALETDNPELYKAVIIR